MQNSSRHFLAISPRFVSRRGFTLVELLVVITIIGILIALLLPAVQAAREAARRLQCTNNLKQLGLATLNYEAANHCLPVSVAHIDTIANIGSTIHSGMSWFVGILPYIENQGLYDALDLRGEAPSGKGIMNPSNAQYIKKTLPALMCPSDSPAKLTKDDVWCAVPANLEFAVTNYAGVIGPSIDSTSIFSSCTSCSGYCENNNTPCTGTFWRYNIASPVTIADIKDGTSNTIIVGEVLPDYDSFKVWALSNGACGSTCPLLNYKPPIGTFDPWSDWANMIGFRSAHPGGVHFTWADGHVSFLNETINNDIYHYLSTRAGGESITIPID